METVNPARRRTRRRFLLPILGLGVLFLLIPVLLGAQLWPAELVWHLATGWIRHLVVNLPHLRWNPATLALSTAALLLGLFLLHHFVRSLGARKIRPSVTLRSTGILLAATAAAIAMTGIVHELAWLVRSPMIHDRSRAVARVETMHHGRQLHLALLEFSHEGIHPRSIDEITRLRPELAEITTYPVANHGRFRESFVLLQPGSDPGALPPDTPLLGALGLSDGRAVIITADGAVERLGPDKLESRLSAAP